MLNLLYIFATGALLLLSFLMISRVQKSNRRANNWFSVFLFFTFCVFLDDCFVILGLEDQVSFLLDLLNFPLFALAPALYLSVSCFTYPSKKFLRIEILHFLPVLMYILFPILVLSLFDLKTIELYLEDFGAWLGLFLVSCMFLQIGVYTILSLLKIHRHQKNIRLFASSTDQIDLSWLQYFLYGVASLVLLWLGEYVIPHLSDYAYAGYFLGVYYLAYFVLRQKEIFPFTAHQTQEIIEVMEEIKATEEKRNALFPHIDLKNEITRLNELMQSQKPYLDNELNLPKLAQHFERSNHELSFILNDGLRENFYEFVNRYRVEESKRLLLDSQYRHLNMLGIAFEAGFNSKTAFNTAFKKMTGKTPSEYRKSG